VIDAIDEAELLANPFGVMGSLASHQGDAGRRPAGNRGRWQGRRRRPERGRESPAPRSPWTARSNEIPAVRELLKAFTDLAGAVMTVDALHTQSDTVQAITPAT
jgi:hypothetical protein